jgi:hypothetical protein
MSGYQINKDSRYDDCLLKDGSRELTANWDAGAFSITAESFSGWGIVPVGGVVAWMKSFTNTPALPDGFVEGNGQTLSDSDSVYNGQTIPNLNGSGGTKRFLRGSTTSGTTGGSETHTHCYSGTACSAPPNQTVSPGATGTPVTAAGPSHSHTVCYGGVTQAKSTLPSYYEVVWVIRVK